MIYEFKSQATGTVLMNQGVAETLLQAMGKTPGKTGVITVAQMPEAIDRLNNYLPAEQTDPNAAATPAADAAADDEDEEPPVSLRVHAYPLIEMLKRAHKGGKDITWGV